MVTVDKVRVKRAIQKVETQTSGQICVSLSQPFWGDVTEVAQSVFDRLGLASTKHRNAVLFFVVPARHRFVVLGDCGIHEKVGQEFWYAIAGTLAERFRQGDFTGGIVAGIEAVGEGLARHFPRPDTGANDWHDEDDQGTDR
jgi:uncharacterized membrane protein